MIAFENLKLAIYDFLSIRGLNEYGQCNLRQWRKSDKTIVTELDVFISDMLKQYFKDHPSYSHYNFYSEEDFSTLKFPTIIADPIDGTEGLVRGTGESVVSLAIMENRKIEGSHGIIYNPFTGLEVNSFHKNNYVFHQKTSRPTLLGLVSRHEWNKGAFIPFMSNDKFRLIDIGSIAYKLAFLSLGMCDFVISYRPKQIWDIAAGCILAEKAGYHLYSCGKKITEFNEEVLPSPLLWCQDINFQELSEFFCPK